MLLHVDFFYLVVESENLLGALGHHGFYCFKEGLAIILDHFLTGVIQYRVGMVYVLLLLHVNLVPKHVCLLTQLYLSLKLGDVGLHPLVQEVHALV